MSCDLQIKLTYFVCKANDRKFCNTTVSHPGMKKEYISGFQRGAIWPLFMKVLNMKTDILCNQLSPAETSQKFLELVCQAAGGKIVYFQEKKTLLRKKIRYMLPPPNTLKVLRRRLFISFLEITTGEIERTMHANFSGLCTNLI